MMIIVPPQITEEQWARMSPALRWALVIAYCMLGLTSVGVVICVIWLWLTRT